MDLFESAWKSIVRPTQIKVKSTTYGPQHRLLDDCLIVRTDIDTLNRNNKKLSGFIFSCPEFKPVEVILYLHGNGGLKIQALPLVELIPKFHIAIAAFDLAGCGNSDPEYLTYGVNQVYDIRDMIEELRIQIGVERVTLWGRSMGALCGICFAQAYPDYLNSLVLDSPFRSLDKVIDKIADRQISLPSFLMKPLMYLVKKKAVQETKCEIFEIDYLQIFGRIHSSLPVLFIYSQFDAIVPNEEVFQFYNIHEGPKDLCQIFQTHDEQRPQKMFEDGVMWITRCRKKNIDGLMQVRQATQEKKKKLKKANSSFCC